MIVITLIILRIVSSRYQLQEQLLLIQSEQKKNLERELEKAKAKYVDMLNLKAFAEIAAQVAHDIRSPLVALKYLSEEKQETTSKQSEIINLTINRIRRIAEKLLDQRTQINQAKPHTISELESLLTNLIIEKEGEYQNMFDVQRDQLNPSHDFFIYYNSDDLQRILSNFINNSLEAVENENKKIKIFLDEEENYLVLSIQDNGRGIPESVLQKLGKEEIQSSKQHGNGIGVKFSVSKIKSWGGEVLFDSVKDKGTTAKIFLKRTKSARPWSQ